MTVGILQLKLFIPQANSLKSKRQALRSLKDKIRSRFNVSVAEVGELEKWQRAHLAVASLNSDKRAVNAVLSKIINLTDSCHNVELVDQTMEFI